MAKLKKQEGLGAIGYDDLLPRLEFRFEINGGIGASDLNDLSQAGTDRLYHQRNSGDNDLLVWHCAILFCKNQFQRKGCV